MDTYMDNWNNKIPVLSDFRRILDQLSWVHLHNNIYIKFFIDFFCLKSLPYTYIYLRLWIRKNYQLFLVHNMTCIQQKKNKKSLLCATCWT